MKKIIGIGYALLACNTLLAQNSIIKSNDKKPNIIFILADDMGYGDISALGHPYVKTPNLDRLIHEGTTFNNFYAAATVSAPSRVAFMTGLYPSRESVHHIYLNHQFNQEHGMPYDALDPDLLTVADVMKKAGYKTCHIGKWHLTGRENQYFISPKEYGFDESMISHDAGQHPVYRDRFKSTKHFVSMASHWIVSDVISYIERNKDSKQPFYINLWTLAPHSPLNPLPEEMDEYKNLKTSPNDFKSWMADYVGKAKNMNDQMKTYCATMTGLDNAIGRLLKYLDSTGLADNTIIIFSSDNGPEDYNCGDSRNAGMGNPGIFRGRKRSSFTGGVHVPCIVRWPGHVPAGKVNSSIWSGVDFLPTLAGLVHVKIPKSTVTDGEDVSPLFYGKKAERKQPLYWEWKFEIFGNQKYRPKQLALFDHEWRFYCDSTGNDVELYNVKKDPEERNNCKNEYPSKVKEYSKKTIAKREEIKKYATTKMKKNKISMPFD